MGLIGIRTKLCDDFSEWLKLSNVVKDLNRCYEIAFKHFHQILTWVQLINKNKNLSNNILSNKLSVCSICTGDFINFLESINNLIPLVVANDDSCLNDEFLFHHNTFFFYYFFTDCY